MNINPSIFKAYDIRGIYNADFDDEFAYKLGLAYCQLRREEMNKEKFTVVAGRDMRLSSPQLHEQLIKGLIDGGAQVIDVGLVSTPTFYFAVAHYKYDGGVMVSASHNPKEYNGFKMVRQMAAPISESSGIMDLKKIILEEELIPHHHKGSVTKKENIVQDQVAYDLKFIDISAIKPLSIVFDTANAMGALYFEELFKKVPQITLKKMNWELDGSFPHHEADPFKTENVKDLCAQVIKIKADLGIATDGDSDRIFFIDDTGIPVQPGIMRAILCKIFLREKPGATICYDIRPGRITYDTIIENGGTPLVTRVGHSLIKEAVIDSGAYFAGESSGHFMLNMESEGCYEVPGIVALKILVELSQSGMKLSEYVKPFEKYFSSGEINMKVENPQEKIALVKEKYSDLPTGQAGGKITELDGLSVEFSDYWFNLRVSNTESLLRLNLEAISEQIMQEKRDEIVKLIND